MSNRTERNEMIIKLAKELKTNKEIAEIIKNTYGEEISERTIRRIVSDADIKRSVVGRVVMSNSDKNVQMSGYPDKIPDYIKSYIDSIIDDRYESLLESNDKLLDAQEAEIANLKSELIEAKNIATQSLTTNDIKSSKKYILKPIFNDGSSVIYANYDELKKYLPYTAANSSCFFPESGIDKRIETDGYFRIPRDGKQIEYCTEISIDSLADKISELTTTIRNIQKEIKSIKEQL